MGVEYNGQVKIDTARRAVSDVLPDVAWQRRTGLVTYAGCSRVDLRVRPARETSDEIISKLLGTRARGDTPLTRAVGLAHRELAALGEPGIIVLVTDGLESCSGDPCAYAKLIGADAHDIPVHVIGFALAPEPGPTQLRCLTEATGGTYADARSLAELQMALRRVLGCPMLSSFSHRGPVEVGAFSPAPPFRSGPGRAGVGGGAFPGSRTIRAAEAPEAGAPPPPLRAVRQVR